MPIARSPLVKHPVGGKSDELTTEFASQFFIIVFGGDVSFFLQQAQDALRVNSGQRGRQP